MQTCLLPLTFSYIVLVAENSALSKVVNRTVEVDDQEWAALHKHSKNHAKPPVDLKHKRFVQR